MADLQFPAFDEVEIGGGIGDNAFPAFDEVEIPDFDSVDAGGMVEPKQRKPRLGIRDTLKARSQAQEGVEPESTAHAIVGNFPINRAMNSADQKSVVDLYQGNFPDYKGYDFGAEGGGMGDWLTPPKETERLKALDDADKLATLLERKGDFAKESVRMWRQFEEPKLKPEEREESLKGWLQKYAERELKDRIEAKRAAGKTLDEHERSIWNKMVVGAAENAGYMAQYTVPGVGVPLSLATSAADRTARLSTDEYDVDDDGNLYLSKAGDDEVTAAIKGLAGAAAETAINVYGGKVAGKLLGKGARVILRGVGKKAPVTANLIGKVIKKYVQLAEVTKLNDPIGETWFEEYPQALVDSGLGLDLKQSEMKGKPFAERMLKAHNDFDPVEVMLSMAFLMSGQVAMSTASATMDHKTLNRNLDNSLKLFGGLEDADLKGVSTKDKILMARRVAGTMTPEKVEVLTRHLDAKAQQALKKAYDRQQFYQQAQAEGVEPTFELGGDGRNPYVDTKSGIGIIPEDGKYRVVNRDGTDVGAFDSAGEAIAEAKKQSQINVVLDQQRQKKADYALKEAERLAGGMPVRVFNTEAEMLQEFPEIAESPDYQEGITGVRHKGGMVLILDNLISPSEVVRTIMHEGGAHEGIRRALGDKAGLDQFLGNLAGEQFELGKRRLKLGGQEFIDQLTEADEALATVYEHRLADPTAYQKSVAWLHDQLRKVTPNLKYTDADIEVLMADAQQKVMQAEGSVERGYISVDRGYSGAKAAVEDARARMSQEARAAEQARRRAMADEANKPRVAPADDDVETPPKAPTQPQQRGMSKTERRAELIAGMEQEGSGVSYPVEDGVRHEPDQDRDPAAQVETQAGDTAQQAVRQMESDERLKARYPQEYQDALGAVDGDAENAIGLLREQTKAMEESRRVSELGRTILDKLDNKRTLSPQDVRFLAANDILGPDLYKLGYRRVKATGEWRNIDASADDADAAPTSIAPDTSVVAGQTVTQSPSEAQKKAGNYKKAHVSIDGHDITIENPVGSTRSGKDRNGSEWHNEMKTDYGYIKGTVGHDKDHLDVIIKPGYKGGSGSVFVVDQIDPDTGKFDEHKVVFGADNTTEAIELYESNYAPGWKGGAGITEMDADDFKAWAYDTSKRGPKGGALSPSTPTAPTSPPQRPVADAQAANEQGVSASLSLDSATAEPLPWTVTSKDGSRLVFRSQAEAQAVADKWNRLVPETEAVVNAPSPAPRSPATATPPQVPAKNANPPEIRVSPIVSNTGKNIGVTVVRDANPDRDAERAEVEAALARGEKVPMDVLERFPWMAADEVIKPYVQGLSSLSDKQLRAEEKRIGDELNTWASKTKTIMPDGTLNPALGNRAYFEISNKFAAVNREIDKRKAAPAAPAAPQETIAGTRAVAQRIVNAENALYDVDVWSEEELSRLDKLRQERDKLRQKPKVEVKSPVANLSTEDQKRAKPPELKALYAESGEKPAAAAAPARFPRGAMATTVYNEDGVSYTGRIVSEDSGKGTVTIRATKERKKGLKATAGDYGLDKQGRQITKDVTVPAELVGVIDAVDSGARRTAFERAVMDEIDRKALAELRENIGDQTTVIDQIDKIVEQQDADDADPDEAYEGTRFRKQTETPEFKRWFGGSKVVDADGKPLVVYHGVKDADMRVENGAVVFAPKFDVFDTKGRTEPGAWFSPDPKVAAKYGTPIPFYLKAVAPVREEGPLTAAPENADAVYRMRGKGDSIAQAWEIAVFRPDQIKLATGNRGTFDPDNPDIRFRKASDADNLAEPFPMKPSMEVTKVEDIEDNYNKLMQWKKDVAAWADKAPRVLPFIFTYDESSRPELVGNGHVNVVHANTRNTEKPWRYSSFSHKNGVVDMTPNGHSEFKTKGEAVVEAMSTPGTKYDPSIRFRRSLTEADATAEPVFFSQLRRTLEAKMPNRMTVMALRGMIDPAKGSGIKADEIEWTGLKDFLDGKNPGDYVTKAEALEATKDVEIQEVVKEQTQAELDRQEELTALARLGRDRTPEQDARYEQLARRLRIGKDLDNATKFEQYQLPGGENYREVLLTLPNRERYYLVEENGYWWVFDNNKGRTVGTGFDYESQAKQHLDDYYQDVPVGEQYRSSHWEEPNVLAHVRFNERQAANGDKTLFLEEVQSDWHQEGREKGYAGTMPGNYADVRTRRGTKAEGESNWFAGTTPQDERWGATEYEAKQNWLKAKQEAGVPDAPFKDTSKGWARLAFKRMLRWAAENGFDRIAWTTGEQQAERYDLSKQIKDLQAEKRKDGSYYLRVYPQNAELQEWSADNDSKLAEMVGKELAAKMARQQPGKLVGYSGLDLKVGGEGMRTFYDKILPSIANNIGKKFGARVEDTKLGTEVDGWAILRDGIPINQDRYATAEQAHTVMRQRGLVGDGYGTSYHDGNVVIAHSLPVTPAMRDSVMQGQTMFRRAVTPDVEREFASLTSTLNLPKGTRAERQAALDEWIKGNPKEYAALEKLRGDVLKAAGYMGPVWHGGAKGITSFSRDFGSGRFYFSDNEKTAQFFARQTGQVYPSRLKIGKPLRIDYDAEYGYSRFDAANFDELERRAIKSGNDGMIVENVRDYDGNRATQFVVFSPSQIKSADPLALDDSGELITPRRWAEEDTADIRFRRPIVTPEQDKAYMDAVERGDTAAAQRMVDEAAKRAGYDRETFRGDSMPDDIVVYEPRDRREVGIFTTPVREIADVYAGGRLSNTSRRFYVRAPKVLDLTQDSLANMRWVNKWSESFDEWIDRQSGEERSAWDILQDGRMFDYEGDWSTERWGDLQATAELEGYDAVVLPDYDNGRGVFPSLVVFDSNNLKLADPVTRDDAGRVIPLSERFNEASNDIRFRKQTETPEQDAAYLTAVNSGDMDAAQRMVDEAAKRAGYNVGPVYHGTDSKRDVFDRKFLGRITRGTGTDWGFFFTDNESLARKFAEQANPDGGVVERVFLRAENPAEIEAGNDGGATLEQNLNDTLMDSDYDSARIDGLIDFGEQGETWLVMDSSQIKSADAVTRDDAGNVIPLSERFNEASNDIRFRPGPATEDEAPIRTTKRYIADWMSSNQLPEYVTNDTVSNQETLDAAKDTLARHDDAANLLISEIMRKARPLTPVERATLLLEQAMLETDVAKERDAVFAARAKGDAVEESYAQSRYEHLLQSAQVMSQVMGEAGSEAGRALQAIKIGILSDMSLASMMRTAEAANGFQPLSGDQIDQVRKLHDSYQQAVDALGEPDMGPGGATGAATRAMKGLQNKRATLSAEERRARAQDMLDALQAEEGGVKDVESLKSIIEQLADAIIQENPSIETGDFNTKLHAAVIDLVGDFMRPTVDEVRDVFSGYGKVTPLNMEAIAKKKRDLRALDQLLAKRDAIERGEAPLRTGQTRDEQTQEMRDLNKQIQDMMKSLGIKATDPARQIKTPLDALKTRLAHRIEDLNASIRSGRKLVTNETPLIYDDEAKGLMARRDALQETYDSIFKTAVLSDQQRLDAAIKAAERNLASWNERLARAEKGDFAQPAKPGLPESQRLDDLRAQAQRARDEVARLQSVLAPEIAERKAAALYNKALDRRAAEYERRLAEKDFAAKPRKVREMSPEVFKKWKAVEDTKAKWRREMEKWRETQLPLATRLVHKGFAASDLFKAVRASFDWSAFGRQGWWTSLSHPQSAKQAFSDMYSATWSERTALEIREELDERPTAQLRMQAGVFMAAVGGEASFNELEEQNQAIALASFQKAGTILTAGIEASNRAYATYLNRMRADLFDLMMETHPTGKPSLDELKLIGQYVNTATGRGNISKHPELARTLSSVLWSPRLQIARIQMTVGWPIVRAACSGQWWAAKAIAKEYARSLAGMSVVAAVGTMIAALFHDDDDPDEQLIGLDPRGSKFGKVRLFGDTWVDITGGASQYLVLGVKLAKGETINKYGKVSDIRGDDRDWGHSAWNEIGRSLRGKSHPVIGLALDLYAGESMIGEKVTPGYFVKNLVLPLSVQNTVETMVAEGVPVGLAVGIMDSLGFAANGYEMDTFKLCEQRFMDAKASMKAATTQKDREMMFARAPFLRMSSRLDALRLQVHRLDRKAKEFKKAGRDARVIIDKASEYRRQFNETLIEASRT